jgi:hypothetical protein
LYLSAAAHRCLYQNQKAWFDHLLPIGQAADLRDSCTNILVQELFNGTAFGIRKTLPNNFILFCDVRK